MQTAGVSENMVIVIIITVANRKVMITMVMNKDLEAMVILIWIDLFS